VGVVNHQSAFTTQRLTYFRRLRAQDPIAARALLVAGWDREKAEARRGIIEALATSLSEADLPLHGPRQEAEVLRRWLASAQRYGVIDQPSLLHEQVVDTCLSLREDEGTHVIAHRDLHDGQLLWDGTDLSLLDLDTAAMAEAALDLGNLWAHADLMAVRGRLGPETHARVRGLLDDLARMLPMTAQRLETYYRSSALRLVFVHAFRPAAHHWLPVWVRHCLGDASPFMPLDLTNDWNNS